MPVAAKKTDSGAIKLPEFSRVRLLRDIDYRGTRFPKGSTGIIVDIHGDGVGYEVEFSYPAEEVLGVFPEDIQSA